MPTLLEVQQAMRRVLFDARGTPPAARELGLSTEAFARLSIYRNTSHSALTSALRLAYPAVEHIVGGEFFQGAAAQFIAGAPPHSAWLDEYGANFGKFLSRFGPAASLPYLADVARVDWAVSTALHAPEAHPLDPARLAALPGGEAALAQLGFVAHPCISLLSLVYPADAIWHAVLNRDDAAMAAIDLSSGPVWLLIERDTGGSPQVHRLSQTAWLFTQRLFAGQPLYKALEEWAAHAQPPEGEQPEGARAADESAQEPLSDAQVLLAEHFTAGRLIDVLPPDAQGLPDTYGSFVTDPGRS